jgi:hypothetical protein
MLPPPSPRITRRQLLVGGSAMAGAVLLAACGDDGGDGDATGTTAAAATGLALAQFFGGPMFVAGEPARLPFGVADADGVLPTEDTPSELEVTILDAEGTAVGDPMMVSRHAEGLPNAYFPLRATMPTAGFYTARTEIDGVGSEMSFQVHAADEVSVIQPGDSLPTVATPTTADAHGVTPICTNDPVCPLHEVTLEQAAGEGRPVALLVATPAFCQIAICGPVLDVLLDVRAEHPDVRFLHAEVYADPRNDPKLERYAPVIEPLGLHFEPCLILAGADGRVVERVDTIYDRVELGERLAQLT